MKCFVHETAVVDEGAILGDGTKVWHWTHISSKSVIGKNCSLGQNVYVANDVTIGDNCKIQNNVSLYDSVHIEDGVFCGPSMVFTNVINPRSTIERKDEYKTILGQGIVTPYIKVQSELGGCPAETGAGNNNEEKNSLSIFRWP